MNICYEVMPIAATFVYLVNTEQDFLSSIGLDVKKELKKISGGSYE